MPKKPLHIINQKHKTKQTLQLLLNLFDFLN